MKVLPIAISLLFAPVPGPDPAPVSIQIPIDTRVTLPDGRILVIRGTVPAWIEEPPPVPVGPTITAVKNEAGQGVERIRSGEVLMLEGVNLWQEGAQVRVQIGGAGPGRVAAMLSFSAERLRVRFPQVAQPVEGPLEVHHNSGTGWTKVTTGPRITVLPATLPPPGKPRLRSFHRPDGTRLWSPFGENWQGLKPGEPLVIRGEGLGKEPGKLLLSGWEAPITSWSENEVQTIVPPLAWLRAHTRWRSVWYPTDLELWTAGGQVTP